MMTFEEIVTNCIIIARDDHAEVGLWGIAKRVNEDMNIASIDEIKQKTMQIVVQIMDAGLMTGDLGDGGFGFWQGSIPELLKKVEACWPKTGLSNFGKLCLFYIK